MKITKQADGKQMLKISKSEWESIGQDNGWMKEAAGEGYNPKIKQAVIQSMRANSINPSNGWGFLTSLLGSLGDLPISQVKAAIEAAQEEQAEPEQPQQPA